MGFCFFPSMLLYFLSYKNSIHSLDYYLFEWSFEARNLRIIFLVGLGQEGLFLTLCLESLLVGFREPNRMLGVITPVRQIFVSVA